MSQIQKIFSKFSLNKFITKCTTSPNVKSVLNNRVLLYGLSVLVLLDIMYLANLRDFNTIVIFILVGFLTSFFCKNMIVIMFIALCMAHILKNPRSLEGATNMNEDDKEDNKEDDKEDDKKDNKNDNKEENYENKEEPEEEPEETIKEELKEFASVQKEIIDSMTKLEPLINKADSFINKFEKYSNKSE